MKFEAITPCDVTYFPKKLVRKMIGWKGLIYHKKDPSKTKMLWWFEYRNRLLPFTLKLFFKGQKNDTMPCK